MSQSAAGIVFDSDGRANVSWLLILMTVLVVGLLLLSWFDDLISGRMRR